MLGTAALSVAFTLAEIGAVAPTLTSALGDACMFAFPTTTAFTEGTITNTVEFWVYIVATVGLRSISTLVLLLTPVFPEICAVTLLLGTVTLYVVPFIIICAELILNCTISTLEFAAMFAVPITWLEFTRAIKLSVPLELLEIHPE